MWPFKPAWMSKNTDKAKKALDQITDQELLAKIALEVPNYVVRKAAVSKIDNQSLLARLARSEDGWVARDALERVTDNAVIDEIALDPASRCRTNAIDRTTSQTILETIARTDPDHGARLVAIARLTNQALLVELAKTATCTGIYAAFVEFVKVRGTNQDGDEYTGWIYIMHMREAALSRITDQSALADVVYGFINGRGESGLVAKSAVRRLHDQSHLKSVITSLVALEPTAVDRDAVLRAAIEQLTDRDFLASLIASGAFSSYWDGRSPGKIAEEKLRELNQKASEESEKERILQFASVYIKENAVEEWAFQFVSAYIDKNPVKGLAGLEVELVKPFFAELFSHYKKQADGKPGLTICTRCDSDITPDAPVFLTGSGRCLCERCSLAYIIGNASDWHYYLGDIAALIGPVPPSLQKRGMALQAKITQLRSEGLKTISG